MTHERFDWPNLMRAGMLQLRLNPQMFWDLTPLELKILLGFEQQSGPMTRQKLDQLRAAYPDSAQGG